MEEVWKDMNLADDERDDLMISMPPTPTPSLSLRNRPHHASNFVLQDFLACRPNAQDHQPSGIVSSAAFYGGSPPVPPPPTVLSLNSGGDFGFLDGVVPDPLRPPPAAASHFQTHQISNVSSFGNDCPFVGFGSLPSFPGSFGKKRVPESDGNSCDRRHKRMIKNRESAARSRARKQAYTNELELEVAHLLKENAELKKQQEELCLAAAAQLPKKHTLHRTLTAPF